MPLDRIDIRVTASTADRDRRALAVAAVGLLIRRYLGIDAVELEVEGARVTLDLRVDGPVAGLLESVARSAPTVGAPLGGHGFRFDWTGGTATTVHTGDLFADVPGADDPELARCLRADLGTIVDRVGADPTGSTADVLVTSVYERRRPDQRADRHRAATGISVPTGATIPAAFAAQVRRHPDRPAVLAADGTLTYRQLADAAAAVAAVLRGTAPRASRIGVLCRHGGSTVTGILGVLAAGHAYVPLDPAFPAERQADVLRDSGAAGIVTDTDHAARAAELAAPDLLPVTVVAECPPVDEPLAGPAGPDDPAYLLYTSGSTGRPKGVVQSHRNVLFGVTNHATNFRITPDDRTSVLTSFGFDMAVTDTFAALLTGAAAVPVDVRAHGLVGVASAIDTFGVTIYHSTPTVYRYLVASLAGRRLASVRAVLLGGEEVSWGDVADSRTHFGDRCVFVNGYGTTEVSFIAQHHLGPDDPHGPDGASGARIPVGQPLAGIDVDLVDPAGRPTCLSGEVIVRSPHVALGYWGRDDLTAERFVEHRGGRAYRTGDLAHRLPDGRLVYAGRADRQVKVRGFRVEPGEIEARLAARPDVAHVAVAPRRVGTETDLVAFVVPAGQARLDAEGLRRDLGTELPDYLVPRTIVPLRDPPLTSTGKLDVLALLDSLVDKAPEDALPAAAGTPLMETIAAAWREVLGVPNVGPDDRFFDLGGHSLMMALVHQRLQRTLARKVPLAWLFQHPTVRSLALRLESNGTHGAALDRVTDRMTRRRAARAGRSTT